jgi:hypothetical protein
LLTAQLGVILVNNQLDAQFFFVYVYCSSLHVSSTHVLIFRRINHINITSDICHSCVGDRMVCRFELTQTYTPDGHLHTVTYTGCRIDTIDSPDDEHMGARNMLRTEINTYEKESCVKLVIFKNVCRKH